MSEVMNQLAASDGFTSKVPSCVEKTCFEFEGVVMPIHMPRKIIHKLRNFAVRPDDLLIVTYPKAGTTWVEQLAILIKNGGDINNLGGRHIFKLVPFLDILANIADIESSPAVIDIAATMPSPRIMKTHSTSQWLPRDIQADDPKGKVIYLARNPKDTAVSYYHFCRYVPQMPSYESWDVFFEEFLAGRAPQGSWFDNVLPWWKNRNHPNVLFLKYEDMKKDLAEVVKQIADFMRNPLSDDVINSIAKVSTFGAMKGSLVSNPDFIIKGAAKNGSFMRKGMVGDWKNYFTEDQNKRFDELYKKELSGTGLDFDFE